MPELIDPEIFNNLEAALLKFNEVHQDAFTLTSGEAFRLKILLQITLAKLKTPDAIDDLSLLSLKIEDDPNLDAEEELLQKISTSNSEEVQAPRDMAPSDPEIDQPSFIPPDDIYRPPKVTLSSSSNCEKTVSYQNMFSAKHRMDPFDGAPNISFESWWKHFELILQTDTFLPTREQKLAHLITHLKGPALRVYKQMSGEEKQQLETIVQKLKDRFPASESKDHAEDSLTNCYQGENESVLDFSNRLSELVHAMMDGETPAAIESTLKREMLSRLKKPIRIQVKALGPKTFDEVITLARRRETLIREEEEIEATANRLSRNLSFSSGMNRSHSNDRRYVPHYSDNSRSSRYEYENNSRASRYDRQRRSSSSDRNEYRREGTPYPRESSHNSRDSSRSSSRSSEGRKPKVTFGSKSSQYMFSSSKRARQTSPEDEEPPPVQLHPEPLNVTGDPRLLALDDLYEKLIDFESTNFDSVEEVQGIFGTRFGISKWVLIKEKFNQIVGDIEQRYGLDRTYDSKDSPLVPTLAFHYSPRQDFLEQAWNIPSSDFPDASPRNSRASTTPPRNASSLVSSNPSSPLPRDDLLENPNDADDEAINEDMDDRTSFAPQVTFGGEDPNPDIEDWDFHRTYYVGTFKAKTKPSLYSDVNSAITIILNKEPMPQMKVAASTNCYWSY